MIDVFLFCTLQKRSVTTFLCTYVKNDNDATCKTGQKQAKIVNYCHASVVRMLFLLQME